MRVSRPPSFNESDLHVSTNRNVARGKREFRREFAALLGVERAASSPYTAQAQRTSSAIERDLTSYAKEILGSPKVTPTISEEQLFAVIVAERLKSSRGSQSAERYLATVSNDRSAAALGGSWEQQAESRLRQLVTEGLLTPSQRRKVHRQAFTAAQFDDNPKALYDDRGRGRDATVAVASRSEAFPSGLRIS